MLMLKNIGKNILKAFSKIMKIEFSIMVLKPERIQNPILN